MEVNRELMDINEIFEKMSYGSKVLDNTLAKAWLKKHSLLRPSLPKESKVFEMMPSHPVNYDEGESVSVLMGDNVVDQCMKYSKTAQEKWTNEKWHTRSKYLISLSKAIESKEKLFLQLGRGSIRVKDIHISADYFSFCSCTWTIHSDKLNPIKTVFLVLSNESPFWVLAFTIAAAISTGSSIIINPCLSNPFPAFVFAEICSEIGLPDGLVNVMPMNRECVHRFLPEVMGKIIYSCPATEMLYEKLTIGQVSFINVNQTVAIIMESCDLYTVFDTLFAENNDSSNSGWDVALFLIQESIEELSSEIRALIVTDEELALRGRKVLFSWFRTAKEAVTLANHCPYSIGSSIWSSNASEAIEMAAQLHSTTIWINCHGLMDAMIPIQPLRKSGFGYYGGYEGMLEFSGSESFPNSELNAGDEENIEIELKMRYEIPIIEAACNAFAKWKSDKKRKEYIFSIINTLSEFVSDMNHVKYWEQARGTYTVRKDCSGDASVSVMQNRLPIGVILIILTGTTDIVTLFVSLVTPALAMGNAVIVVVDDETDSNLRPVIDCFCKNLPHGVFTVVKGINCGYELSVSPKIEALWLSSDISQSEVKKFRKLTSKYKKKIWITPQSPEIDYDIIRKECLKVQSIWMTTKNQFP